MEVKEIAISHYGPLRDVKHRPSPGLQVFFGPNESGKTLLIDAILKLMLGNRIKDFKDIDRVPDLPRGRVALAIEGTEHIFDGSTRLDGVTGLDSNHLRNVFVIRNKDLLMVNQADYLRRVNDQLTGMEGRRLAELKKIVQRRGQLTNPSSTAKLSKSAEYNKIGEQVENAEAAAQQIEEYLEIAREKELGALERHLEDTRRELQGLNRHISIQEQAEKWQEYAALAEMVREHEELAAAAQSLQEYTKTTFLKLQDLESRSQAARETARDSKEKLTQLQPRLAGAEAKLTELEAQHAPLEKRKSKLDYLEQETLAYARTAPPPGTTFARFGYGLAALAAISILLAALGMLPTPLNFFPYAALVGLAILWLAERTSRARAQEHRRRDRTLLQEGAASGIMAATLQELAAAVASEKNSIEIARYRQQQLAETVRDMDRQRHHLEENIRATMTRADDLQHQLILELQRLGVDSLEQFGKRMEKYNLAQAQCDELHQRLEDKFAQVPLLAGRWCDLLKQLPVPENPGIAFDRASLASLRQAKDTCTERIEELQEELSRHQATLANFSAVCQALPLEEETGQRLAARIANLDMLEYACQVLNQFVLTVKARADIACKTLGILETMELEEREKMADLVSADKPVRAIFKAITNQRYTDVILDSELNIRVVNREGLELPATALSQGTFDQLYLALRLSLAKDLLAGKPGFLLLDDAFLCADSDRLAKMLEVLAQLAVQGWHILYFTMDERLAKAAPGFTRNPLITLDSLMS